MDNVMPYRSDIMDKVTGAAKYSEDFYMENMVYAKILWPSVPRARVIKIDISEAQRAPGVVRIVTRKDITGSNLSGMYHIQDRPILIGEGEEVRFSADALALVAAETEEEAERACKLINVEYEELHAIHTVEQAKTENQLPCFEHEIKKGDVEAGFSEAAAVVEEEYANPYAEHAYIEPEAGYAYIDNNGTINVCYGTQDITQNHRMVCKALGYPYHKVRLHVPYVGGGFGGKHSMSVHVYLTLLAHVVRRPVRLVWTREESISYSCKKQHLITKAKMGLDANGHICALQVLIEGSAGPYHGNYEGALLSFMNGVCGPYRYNNLHIAGKMYYTTGSEIGSFRGVGTPDGTFVIETLLDKVGRKLGIDPLTVRRRNWMQKKEEFATQFKGVMSRNISDDWIIAETMETALKAAGPLPKARTGKKVGRGIANAMPAFAIGNSPLHKGSVAELTMFFDGSLLVKLGFPEIGQGITDVAVKLAASAMGTDEAQISVMLSDSHLTPKAGALGFSQATVTAGNAVLDAAEKLKRLLEDIGREYLNSQEEAIYYKRDGFYNGDGIKLVDWNDFADFCFNEVRSLTAQGCVVGPPEDNGLYGVTPISTVADVEIDEESGEIKVLQVISCHDIGKTINYQSARGQILGSVIMSMGVTTMEEFILNKGRALTPSFAEYVIPTAMDVPEHNKVIFIEGNYGNGCPQGAKGVGEHGMYATGSAISNAILDAVGVSMTQLPITPEKLLRKLNRI